MFVVSARLLLAVDQLSGADLDIIHSVPEVIFHLREIFNVCAANLNSEINYTVKAKKKCFLNPLL